MKTTDKNSPQFAVCIENSDYPVSLELHKLYQVLPDEEAELEGDPRVIDESGEDYLYPASYFLLIDWPEEAQLVLTRSFALQDQ
jgi:hypothetical protein